MRQGLWKVPLRVIIPTLFILMTVFSVAKAGETNKAESVPYESASKSYLDLRDLLSARKFQQLESELEKYHSAVEQDENKEIELEAAYEVLTVVIPEHEALFDAWVSEMPDSHIALTARAKFLYFMGYSYRGNKWMRETSQVRISNMNVYHGKALADLKSALQLKPSSIEAHKDLISVLATSGGSRAKKLAAMQLALELHPKSFPLRWRSLYFLQPKWGGSMELIDAMLEDMRPYSKDNPELLSLLGYKDYLMADSLFRKKDYQAALSTVNKAIEYGENAYYFSLRGDLLHRLGEYKKALSDYEKTIELRPYRAKHYYKLIYSYHRLNREDEKVAVLEHALILDPYDRKTLVRLGEEYNYNKQYEPALALFEKALYFDQDDADILYYVGKILSRNLHQKREGSSYLLRSIMKKNDNAFAWYEYATALYNLHDCKAFPALERYAAMCTGSDVDGCFAAGVNFSKQAITMKDGYGC